jgi:zinc transporter ZupT
LIVAALPLLYDRIERRSWKQVVLIGVVVGAWMPVAALVAWLLAGW